MIESPKNFIEQFQNFIEHIAGVMKTFLTKEAADSYYLGKSEKAVSAGSVQWEGVKSVPDNVKNALSFITQTLTDEQKEQVVKNLAGTFLPISGGTITGDIIYDDSDSYYDFGYSWANRKGALLSLRGEAFVDNPCGFELFARSSNKECILIGGIDGSLTWKNENILRFAFYDGLGVTTFAESPEGVFIVGGGTAGASDNPVSGSHGVLTTVVNIGTKFQTFQPDNQPQIYKRWITDGVWGAWKSFSGSTWVNFYGVGAITSGYCTYPTIVNVMCTRGSCTINLNGQTIYPTGGYHGDYREGVCFCCPAGATWSMTGANISHVTYAELRS